MPTGICRTTVFESGWIHETVPSPWLATHTAPPPTAIPLGLLPTEMVWRTLRVSGSTRETVFAYAFVTHTAPWPNATLVGAAATAIWSRISLPSASINPTAFPTTVITPGFSPRVARTLPTAAAASASIPIAAANAVRRRGRVRAHAREPALPGPERAREQLTVEGVGLGRRVRAKLLRKQSSAELVHPQRLGAVARGSVGLHQAPVPRLSVTLECDRLRSPLRRLRRVARPKTCFPETVERTETNSLQLAALLIDPAPVLSRQERRPRQRRSLERDRFRVFDLTLRQRCLGLANRVGRGDHVDPGRVWEAQPVAAECAGESPRTVEPALREHAAQLAHEHRERLLPRRRRRFAPERLRELFAWHRSALLGHEIGKQEPTLPPREALLVDRHAVCLDCDSTREKNFQL